MRTRFWILVTVLTVVCGTVNAQHKENRKKVAVVLAGGGAKGMAHVGVLKVLEQAGIPVDIVTGNSMGSIVGGLYAIGYNAHSLDSVARAQDWTYIISDKEDLRNQSLSDIRKQNTYVFSTGITTGKRDRSAGGFIKGKNLAELFEKLCVGYTDSLDFSRDLPIPFACVATDILDYTEYDFHSGRLPVAMRASMAIPAVFSPVRLDGHVLVDGMLRNNFPVDIARQMGADYVIGVSVHDRPKTYDDVWGTMSVLSQIIDMNCKNKFEENKANTDVYMYVDPHEYGAASFSPAAIDSLIRFGEEEAMRHWDELMALKRTLGLDSTYRPPVLHPLQPTVMTEKHHVVGFEYVNMTPQDEKFLSHKFHFGRLDSIHAGLEKEITTSMRVDLFYQSAECHLVPRDSGVVVRLTAGNRKSMELHAGFRFDTEEYAAVQLGLDIPLKTSTPVSTEITLRLGKRSMARGELTVHPSSFTRPMVNFTFYRNDMDLYHEGDCDYNIRYNQYQSELAPINFDLRHFNLQMGLRWDYVHYRNKLESEKSQVVTLENEHYFSYRARLRYNSEDNWYFPTRGTRFWAEYSYLTNNFAKLDCHDADGNVTGKTMGMSDVSASLRTSFSFGKHFTLQPMLYGRMLFGSVVPVLFNNTVGGDWFNHYIEHQMPFVGIGNLEYVRNQFVAAQLQAQLHFGRNHYVLLRMAGAQDANKLKELFDSRTMLGVQGAYFYNTMFGPVGATLGYSNRTKSPYFYLNLGYEF